jgi:hypothetical protein
VSQDQKKKKKANKIKKIIRKEYKVPINQLFEVIVGILAA